MLLCVSSLDRLVAFSHPILPILLGIIILVVCHSLCFLTLSSGLVGVPSQFVSSSL